MLEILFEDEDLVLVNKPAGMLVHRTALVNKEESVFALQTLRDQINQHVHPVHRLDRPTSGILIFTKNPESAKVMQAKLVEGGADKSYLCLVRGYLEPHGIIERELKKDLIGELQPAKSEYWTLDQTEIPFSSSSRYPTSRYSLLKVFPHTGKMHQIRRHMAQVRHYIIGDTSHGDNKQNNFFRNELGLKNMLLHSWKLSFGHPISKSKIEIEADIPLYFKDICEKINLTLPDKG